MKTIDVDPADDPAWARLVESTDSDVFHSPRWLRVLRSTYGFEPRASITLDKADIPSGGTPYVRVQSLAETKVAIAPFSDYCDPLAPNSETWKTLAGRLLEHGHPVVLRSRTNPLPAEDPRFRPVGQARWHGLDLTPGCDDILASMHPSARRAIRKAQRSGLLLRDAHTRADLRAFFDLHLQVRKLKYRLLAQPFRFFEAIWQEFIETGQGRITFAVRDGAPVAGVLFLRWKDRLYYKFNASDGDALELRPNDLIVWDAIERGTSDGMARLDFGLSDWDQEGLARYKAKFGATEGVIRFLRHDPDVSGPARGATAPLEALTDLLTSPEVPDSVTEAAGDVLYRYFV